MVWVIYFPISPSRLVSALVDPMLHSYPFVINDYPFISICLFPICWVCTCYKWENPGGLVNQQRYLVGGLILQAPSPCVFDTSCLTFCSISNIFLAMLYPFLSCVGLLKPLLPWIFWRYFLHIPHIIYPSGVWTEITHPSNASSSFSTTVTILEYTIVGHAEVACYVDVYRYMYIYHILTLPSISVILPSRYGHYLVDHPT